MRFRRLLARTGISLLLGAPFGCNSKPAPEPSPPVISPTTPAAKITRVYDIRDLIIWAPDFYDEPDFSPQPAEPAPGLTATTQYVKNSAQADLFGGSGSTGETPGPSRQELADSLVDCIKSTITPTAWTTGSQIRELQGQLVITASADTHRELTLFLAEAHRRASIQVTLTIRILDPRDLPLDQFDPSLGKKLRIALSPVGPRNGFELTNAEVDQLISELAPDPRLGSTITRPRITLFNGQRAYILVADQSTYIRGYKPTVHGGFEPVINIAQIGTLISAAVGVSEDHKQAAIDLHLKLADLNGMGKVPFTGAPAEQKLMIDLPDMRVRELHAIASVPSGKTVLFRGLRDVSQQLGWNAPATRPTTRPSGGETKERGPQALSDNVIVLVTPMVIIENLPLSVQTPR